MNDLAQTNKSSESSASTELKTRAGWVWVRLIQKYGESWRRKFGDVPNEMWLRSIAKLTDEELKHGIENLPAHMPSEPEFVGLCKPYHPYAHHKALPAKPFQKASEETVQRELANMREILK